LEFTRRFCASANLDAGVPFYPAAFHAQGAPAGFALAFENGELAYTILQVVDRGLTTNKLKEQSAESPNAATWSFVQSDC
jgi:hypothetical protein